MLALANGLWVGDIPHELAVLTLAERLLVARYFPVAYIVKLFLKDVNACFFDGEGANKGLKGNVSTYRLDTNEIAGMLEDRRMPPPARLLSSVLSVTFVGPRNIPESCLPHALRVRRRHVHDALRWMKNHNMIYRDIEISEERLQELPANAVPIEILAGLRYSDDIGSLAREHASYVPEDDPEEISTGTEGNEPHAVPSGMIHIDVDDGVEDRDEDEEPWEPGVDVPLQAHGVVNAGGDDITDHDLFTHALANTSRYNHQSFNIRRGSEFVNEYARYDELSGVRTDSGTENPNHLLGTFPVLFPYGLGGFEVGRREAVPYKTHIKWALQYADRRFRKDLHFVFQVFGVLQKRHVCHSAKLQLTCCSSAETQALLRTITPSDLLKASAEENRRVPYSNPAVRALRKQVTLGAKDNIQIKDILIKLIRSSLYILAIFNAQYV
ncbi:putative helicase family protein [Lyophyllum shimeji]|uniref:Helicase family protein n=1 Tax=Lyophyllum shimeji TaxID=47721 RepID=A0A9P3PT79_LYOSH|nr:putative helicase family protein [Lyophyllum shimeji]